MDVPENGLTGWLTKGATEGSLNLFGMSAPAGRRTWSAPGAL